MDSDTSTKKIGELGEKIAATFLMKQGHRIVERNYTRRWGELDIITEQNGSIHFIEVKSVSYETKTALAHAVTHETWQPEEQVHRFKLHQLSKAIETWISEHQYEGPWQIDVAAVRLVPRETYATVKVLENIGI